MQLIFLLYSILQLIDHLSLRRNSETVSLNSIETGNDYGDFCSWTGCIFALRNGYKSEGLWGSRFWHKSDMFECQDEKEWNCYSQSSQLDVV